MNQPSPETLQRLRNVLASESPEIRDIVRALIPTATRKGDKLNTEELCIASSVLSAVSYRTRNGHPEHETNYLLVHAMSTVGDANTFLLHLIEEQRKAQPVPAAVPAVAVPEPELLRPLAAQPARRSVDSHPTDRS